MELSEKRKYTKKNLSYWANKRARKKTKETSIDTAHKRIVSIRKRVQARPVATKKDIANYRTRQKILTKERKKMIKGLGLGSI